MGALALTVGPTRTTFTATNRARSIPSLKRPKAAARRRLPEGGCPKAAARRRLSSPASTAEKNTQHHHVVPCPSEGLPARPLSFGPSRVASHEHEKNQRQRYQ